MPNFVCEIRSNKAMKKNSATSKAFRSIVLFFLLVNAQVISVSAQAILFDFDNAPLHISLPIAQTSGGITAYLSATGQGYSIQEANVLGFTPAGFAGYIIYPNSIYLADLLIKFDHTLSDFSIMYSPQELGCDNSATLRVTAYMSGNFVGTNTRTATNPGTWPVDTLSCSFPQGFDSVVVHYASPPPTCQDYGVIFMADNMRVTAWTPSAVSLPQAIIEKLVVPNPVSRPAVITISMTESENISLTVYDMTGRLISTLFEGNLPAGEHCIYWEADEVVTSGA